MIKITFQCNGCGHKKGTVITDDRETVVECDNCKLWETMGEKTSSK